MELAKRGQENILGLFGLDGVEERACRARFGLNMNGPLTMSCAAGIEERR